MSDDFSAASPVDGGDRVSSALRDEVWSLLRHNITPAIGRNRLREAAGAAYDNEDLARCFDRAADAIVSLLPAVEAADSSAEFMRDKLSPAASSVAPDRGKVAQLLRGRSADSVKAEALVEAANGNIPSELSNRDRQVVAAWLRGLAAEFDVKADTQKS